MLVGASRPRDLAVRHVANEGVRERELGLALDRRAALPADEALPLEREKRGGRVAVAAERNEGTQRILAEDEAYSLDVGGAYSIARNIDVTAGARYRISRDRLEPLAGAARRDSQAVYIGTAFRF